MRRVSLMAGMVWAVALGAAEAQAATVYEDCSFVCRPVFIAANGETNDLQMTDELRQGRPYDRFRDRRAAIVPPGPGYVPPSGAPAFDFGTTLRNCSFTLGSASCFNEGYIAVVRLGDRNDTANADDAFVYGEAGNDTVRGDVDFFGGPGSDTLSGGGTMYYPEEPGVSVDMHIDLDGVADDGAPGELDNLHPDARGVRIWLDGNHTVIGSDGDNYIESIADFGNRTFSGLGGDDLLHGWLGDDSLSGGTGRDNVQGWGGNDSLVGGPDPDNLSGGSGDDVIDARDGGADGNISCQEGVDTAYVDALDTLVHDCENVIVG
jgi:hypothetical protein